MKAILTHYVPATDHKPSRVIATDGDNRAIVTYHDGSEIDPNRRAMEALCKAIHRRGIFVEGHTKEGRVYVEILTFGDSSFTVSDGWCDSCHCVAREGKILCASCAEGMGVDR